MQLAADIKVSDKGVIIQVYNFDLSETESLQEKIKKLYVQPSTLKTISDSGDLCGGGHYLEMSGMTSKLQRCVNQSAENVTRTLIAFCERLCCSIRKSLAPFCPIIRFETHLKSDFYLEEFLRYTRVI